MLEWTEVILIFGIAVVVPLGLAVVRKDLTSDLPSAHLPLLQKLHPIPAAAAAASFFLDSGKLAGALTVPWFLFTLLLAGIGMARVLSRPTLTTAGIGIDAGLAFIVVGSGWLTLSRLDLNPMGFNDTIVRLTAVHFHFAGFALPIMTGAISRSRLGDKVGRKDWLLPFGTIFGVPLTAIGIITGGWLEWIAATTMALIGLAVAWRIVKTALTQTDLAARWLLMIAGIALSIGMSFAIGYSWFAWFNIGGLPIDRMVKTHGSFNAFGFGVIGLIGLLRSNMLGTKLPNDQLPSAKGTTLALRWGGHSSTDIATTIKPNTPAATKASVLAKPDGRTSTWTRSIEVDTFDTAVAGIKDWAGHKAAGITHTPANPTVKVGQEIAMTIPALAVLGTSATCRIVEVFDEPDRFGFTYASLPHHIVEGVETFSVTRQGNKAAIEVTAYWRPLALAARVLPPLTKALQKRAIEKYLDGIASYR